MKVDFKIKNPAPIIARAEETGLRSGQILFGSLPIQAQRAIIGTEIDPYYRTMFFGDIVSWMIMHAEGGENGELIRLMDNTGATIWERNE